jgi:hypothetical protein
MNTCISVLIIGLIAMPNFVLAGEDTKTFGARSMGLGHASATILDEWAFFNNISGLAKIEKPTAILSYQNYYGLSLLNSIGAGVVFPFHQLGIGIGVQKFGDQYYNETSIGIGTAHNIGNVNLGLKINYHQISIEEIGVKRNLVLEFGGIAEISKQLSFGGHIYNLTQSKINKEKKEFIPVVMKAGLSYKPYYKLILNIESEKQIYFRPLFKTGIEYSIIEKLKIRIGITLNPSRFFCGVGFSDKRFAINYAMCNHPVLGNSHQLSINYHLKKKIEK